MDEITLVRLAQEGQTEAFRQIFEENKRKIYAVAYNYLRNPEDAEDILQETFTKAYHSLSSFNSGKGINFSGWLYRIGVNCCLDVIRRKKTRKNKETEWLENRSVNQNNPDFDPEKKGQIKAIREKVNRLLDKLPPSQRMIFILRHYQGLTIREIAEDLNISEGSVKKSLFRAFEKIKKDMKKHWMENTYEMP